MTNGTLLLYDLSCYSLPFCNSFSDKLSLCVHIELDFSFEKMPGKRLSFEVIQLIYNNYELGKNVQELSEMFSVTRRTIYNVINRAENEGRLELKRGDGPVPKINKRVERIMLRKINTNPQISTRKLAKELLEECDIVVSHETVRQTLIKNKYSSRVARKKPLLSTRNIEKRYSFALNYISQPVDYWDDVIFCDEVKVMLYYNDGPTRVWRKPLTSLENRNIIPTVKFGKMSIMVWGCISSKGVGELAFIETTMDAGKYLSILKCHLVNSARKFGFIKDNKPVFKFYQDNDPKHKFQMVKLWLLYNCGKVIDTPPQSPDLNPIENLWVHLKRNVAKRQPTNKVALKTAILEEWQKIPTNYDLQKLIHSMKNRLQCVINSKGTHTKY